MVFWFNEDNIELQWWMKNTAFRIKINTPLASTKILSDGYPNIWDETYNTECTKKGPWQIFINVRSFFKFKIML